MIAASFRLSLIGPPSVEHHSTRREGANVSAPNARLGLLSSPTAARLRGTPCLAIPREEAREAPLVDRHPSNWRQSKSSTARKIRSRLFHQITAGMLAPACQTGVMIRHRTERR